MAIAAVGCGEDAPADSPSPTTGGTGGSGAGGGTTAVVGGGGPGGAGGSEATPYYVFITSQTFTGNLSEPDAEGELGADVKCNAAAATAELPGTYNAFLSLGIYTEPPNTIVYSNDAPHDRVQGDGPWVVVGTEEILFGSRAALSLGAVDLEGRLRDEYGSLPTPNGNGFVLFWSGGVPMMTQAEVSCDRWRVDFDGSVGQVGCVVGCEPTQWLSFSPDPTPCTEPQRLVCFAASPAAEQ